MEENKNNLKLDDFEIKNGVLKKYKGKETVVVIPDSVTEIGEYAFRDCKELTSVTIPSSVTKIGIRAFFGCKNLKTVYFQGTKEQWEKIQGSGKDEIRDKVVFI